MFEGGEILFKNLHVLEIVDVFREQQWSLTEEDDGQWILPGAETERDP